VGTLRGLGAGIIPPPRPTIAPAASAARLRPSLRVMLLVPARIRHGRPGRLVLRIVAAALAALLVWHTGAGTPAVAALFTGIATWLVLSARGDLAPPPGR
jgi:hypothetical protein